MAPRLLIGLWVALVAIALVAAPLPSWAFEYEPDACCCHHAGQCPCAGHHLPKHEKAPTARSCGSGGHATDAQGAPECELPPPAVIVVTAEARPFEAPPVPSPHPAPDLDPPAAPS